MTVIYTTAKQGCIDIAHMISLRDESVDGDGH